MVAKTPNYKEKVVSSDYSKIKQLKLLKLQTPRK